MAGLEAVLKWIDKINDRLGKWLSYAVLLMFALVLGEVIRRYFFNAPTVWANELVQMIFGAYVVLSGGHILLLGGHVNVDILYSRLSDRGKAVADILSSFLFFAFVGMLFVYGGSLALESLMTLERTQSAWDPPAYPIKLMIPLGALLLLLQGTTKLIRDIMTLAKLGSGSGKGAKEVL